jgi:hypothetical protein
MKHPNIPDFLNEEPVETEKAEDISNDRVGEQEGKEDKSFPLMAWAVIVFIFWFFYRIWRTATDKVKPEKKTTFKTVLHDFYGVDKRTFAKWVVHFCDPKILSMANFKNAKKLTDSQVAHIKEVFGDPKEFRVMSKAQIVDESGGHYGTLRKYIRTDPERYGITVEAFSKLSCFPPAVAHRIIKTY